MSDKNLCLCCQTDDEYQKDGLCEFCAEYTDKLQAELDNVKKENNTYKECITKLLRLRGVFEDGDAVWLIEQALKGGSIDG